MTCTARSTSGYGGFSNVYGRGSSESARKVDNKLRQVVDQRDQTALVQISKYRTINQIEEVLAACSEPNWGGYEELPISAQAANEVRQIVNVLPMSFSIAEVTPEPLGALALEWRFAPSQTMVFSVSGRGVIEYAGLAGQSEEFHGRVAFTGELPATILHHLNSTRDARDA